uniref:Ground-like domain-containing protein n=1 Tax=Panagrellus redivivus TaxID=6233 RepID=A0A7E5A0E0_PANRE
MLCKILLVAAIIPLASGLFFGGGCGCAPPPPPPCLPPIQLPSLCLPPPPRLCLPQLPSPCGCGRKKRESPAPAPTVRGQMGASTDALCNNNTLRKIILKNLTENPIISKAAIHAEAKAQLGGEFVVVCAQGAASFIADTHNYCIDGSNNQTCYVFEV